MNKAWAWFVATVLSVSTAIGVTGLPHEREPVIRLKKGPSFAMIDINERIEPIAGLRSKLQDLYDYREQFVEFETDILGDSVAFLNRDLEYEKSPRPIFRSDLAKIRKDYRPGDVFLWPINGNEWLLQSSLDERRSQIIGGATDQIGIALYHMKGYGIRIGHIEPREGIEYIADGDLIEFVPCERREAEFYIRKTMDFGLLEKTGSSDRPHEEHSDATYEDNSEENISSRRRHRRESSDWEKYRGRDDYESYETAKAGDLELKLRNGFLFTTSEYPGKKYFAVKLAEYENTSQFTLDITGMRTTSAEYLPKLITESGMRAPKSPEVCSFKKRYELMETLEGYGISQTQLVVDQDELGPGASLTGDLRYLVYPINTTDYNSIREDGEVNFVITKEQVLHNGDASEGGTGNETYILNVPVR